MNKVNFRAGKIPPIYAYWSLIIILTLILLYRLFYLQILHQSEYRLQSDQNRIREVTLQPLRGRIYDREGNLLVNNSPAFTLYAVPYYLRHEPDLYNKMAHFVDKKPDFFINKVKKNIRGYFNPVRLLRQVDFSVISKIEEKRRELPGIDFWIEPIRSYPSSIKASHLLGYLGEISESELQKHEKEYRQGDIIGKAGIEKYYESLLHGEPGVRYVEVDVMGREIKTLKEPKQRDPIPGNDLFLTLDSDLQFLSENLMQDNRGSIIMMDLRDGGILAMVSNPDYNSANLAGAISPEVWSKLQSDPNDPLYARSIQSVYPPGSTFKLVLALAALTTHAVDPDKKVTCPGYHRFGRRWFKCWKAEGHGRVNLYQAIEQSCNVYFYKLGLKVGLDNWSTFAKKLHFGKKTGIDLPLESSGQVPDKSLLDKRYGEGKWTRGLLLNLAVGQGDLVVTPIQMLQLACIIANNGKSYTPHLLHHSRNPVSGEISYYKPDSTNIESIPDTAYQIILEGMRMVVHGKHGTGKAAFVPNIIGAGKTGTAQNPHGEDHAWYIGFAPFDSPQVAIIVLVENGGGGGRVAAPKAGALLRLYFKKRLQKESDQLIVQTTNHD